MMLEPVGLTVRNCTASRRCFSAALAPLDIAVLRKRQGEVGVGRGGKPECWFGEGGAAPQSQRHSAFAAENRAQQRAKFAPNARLSRGGAGGRGDRQRAAGLPGMRESCHPNSGGAFLIGPWSCRLILPRLDFFLRGNAADRVGESAAQ